MPYRESAKVVEYHQPHTKLTLVQRYYFFTKKHYELCEEKWYRAYLGGLWSKATVAALDTTLLTHVGLSGEPSAITLSVPFVASIAHVWVQAPTDMTECIHENLRGWLTKTTNLFSDNYRKFTEMSMVYQRFNRSTALACDCEKYHHRRSE
jgi:hypothetical protein